MSDLTEREKQLVSALHGLLFLQFRHWPLDERDREIPFVKSIIVPILPLVEVYHEELHNGPVAMRQITAQERADIINLSDGSPAKQRW